MIMQRIGERGAATAGWTWLGWGNDEETARATVTDEEKPPSAHAYVDQSITRPADVVEGADEYRKRMLWPLCHGGLLDLAVDGQAWQCYQHLSGLASASV